MNDKPFRMRIEFDLIDPDDVWDLYNIFLSRHSQLAKYAKRAPTPDDKRAAAERADRWLAYSKIIETYYRPLEGDNDTEQ